MLLTTDKTSKKLPTTDRKNINRLPTWADIINICFQKKEHFAFFFWPLGRNLFKFMTHQMVKQKELPLMLIQDWYINTTNTIITEATP